MYKNANETKHTGIKDGSCILYGVLAVRIQTILHY